jgi:hypothetical protein
MAAGCVPIHPYLCLLRLQAGLLWMSSVERSLARTVDQHKQLRLCQDNEAPDPGVRGPLVDLVTTPTLANRHGHCRAATRLPEGLQMSTKHVLQR